MTKLIECPRDAWRGLKKMIPTEIKIQYINQLIAAGFRHVDVASFVSPSAVPQMADAESVLAGLERRQGVELIGIVVNSRGAERAIATERITTLGYPYSVSPQFLKRNQNQSTREALTELNTIRSAAQSNDLGLVVYISMAFGNPYDDPWSIVDTLEECSRLADLGVTQLSLADTVGTASVGVVTDLCSAVTTKHPEIEVGLHLHTRADRADELVQAAYAANCRRFDGAIGGQGGCPFAQDDLVGNVATETLLRVLAQLGAELPVLDSLEEINRMSDQIAATYSTDANPISPSYTFQRG